jgi:hypothetical protein
LDEVFLKINGQLHYLWRAVDQDLQQPQRDSISKSNPFIAFHISGGSAAIADRLLAFLLRNGKGVQTTNAKQTNFGAGA